MRARWRREIEQDERSLLEIIQDNRKAQGLTPLVQCEGGCGRMVEGPLCVECDPEGEAKLDARRDKVIAESAK